jgi:hypothetical protein
MAWPYKFLDLTTPQKHSRRILLDRYGVFAQLSALIPILAFLLFRLANWVFSERKRQREYAAVPTSPGLKRERGSKAGVLVQMGRKVRWWLEGTLGGGWGVRGRWLAGLGWGAWLLFLSFHRTGDGRFFSCPSPIVCFLCFEELARSSCSSVFEGFGGFFICGASLLSIMFQTISICIHLSRQAAVFTMK